MQEASSKSIATIIKLDSDSALRYWIDNLAVLVCVVKPEPGQSKTKETPSTQGMQLSVENSDLLQLARLGNEIPEKRIQQFIAALSQKNFEDFAKLTMQETN